ncbi:FIG01363442: possible membrane protein [Alloactinosynnema sp. L-07]|uniref:DUF5685 family protein n=1 Tax=Alloactinosynnema sp. L-07 TaxID=1653480 RepID=UPI00065EF727|nr:DUF5685 family protein [Alloactinosynnema sp. L-07]CRK56159.1 FIG01363442: possible membrane protein [Alloactinosynnema sp. L-07]
MFGILRPCRHRLPGDLAKTWLAHLCGLCLALRDDHGQFARTVTNYDGLVISALVEAQIPAAARRTAGPCALRGMRSASVAEGSGARLAAAVSLVLASAKVRDHVEDGDGVFGLRPVAGAARKIADRWARQGGVTGADIGFPTAVLLDAVGRQGELESGLGLGASVLTATEPTETATAAAFAHTAVLAGKPGNVAPLSEAGRLFGRVAHLIDAVEDLDADAAAGAWNPLTGTGTTLIEARRLCDDAVFGVRLALAEADLRDSALVHALLVHELGVAVDRAFRVHGMSVHDVPPGGWQRPGPPLPPGGYQQYRPPQGAPGPQGPPPPPPHRHGGHRKPSSCLCWRWPTLEIPPKRRGVVLGCVACLYECGTCQMCCRDPYPGPWSGKPRESCDCDCDCCSCCDCSC